MSRERINTSNAKQIIPEGTREFIVSGNLKKMFVGKNKDLVMFIVPVQYDLGLGEQALMENMMGPFLKAMGCKELEGGFFDFDTEQFEGRKFTAEIKHEIDKKGVLRSHMKIDESIPF